MLITVKNEQSDLKISVVQIRRLVSHVLACEKVSCNELSVFLVNAESLSKLHDQFFNDPSPTDCISFPIDDMDGEEYRYLGDIFICPKTALTYAAKNHKDLYEEVSLYIVHALLHLLGYDDREPKEKARMRRKEASLMKSLKQYGLLLKKVL